MVDVLVPEEIITVLADPGKGAVLRLVELPPASQGRELQPTVGPDADGVSFVLYNGTADKLEPGTGFIEQCNRNPFCLRNRC